MSIIEERLKPLEIRPVDVESEYYAVTLLGSQDGGTDVSVCTRWVGFENGDARREIRKGRLMAHGEASGMIRSWSVLGQGHLVVHSVDDLVLFLLAGGNALIVKSVAENDNYIADLLAPSVCVRTGPSGFTDARDLPSTAFNRAPTKKQRMGVLQRDDLRCRVCGRRPADYVDVELHVHHIRPWASGGTTVDDNLITLCHACHTGLEPHGDLRLFNLVDSEMASDDDKQFAREYWEGVMRYRAGTSRLLATLDGSNDDAG